MPGGSVKTSREPSWFVAQHWGLPVVAMPVGLWREHRAEEAWVEIRVEQEKPETTSRKPFLVFCTNLAAWRVPRDSASSCAFETEPETWIRSQAS